MAIIKLRIIFYLSAIKNHERFSGKKLHKLQYQLKLQQKLQGKSSRFFVLPRSYGITSIKYTKYPALMSSPFLQAYKNGRHAANNYSSD